jgi:mono/diheme cytochrome c family protein
VAHYRIVLAAGCIAWVAMPAARAQTNRSPAKSVTEELSDTRAQIRPSVDALPVPLGYTREQLALGDRVFHGEAAGGLCSTCHGRDAKGTPVGSDLTTGMYIWGDGSVTSIRKTILHNMAVAPGMDGGLRPPDVDAVAAYIWALGRANR